LDREQMVETFLTKEMIDAGASLVRELDERGIRSEAAFWLYFPEAQTWKLVIAQAKVGEEGPKRLYGRIQEVIEEMSRETREISLEDVALSKPDAPVVSLLRVAVRTGPGIEGIRFRNNVVNGTVIEDAYIYRLN